MYNIPPGLFKIQIKVDGNAHSWKYLLLKFIIHKKTFSNLQFAKKAQTCSHLNL